MNVRIEYGMGIKGLGEVLEEVLHEVLEGRCDLDQILADFAGMVRWLHELLFISRENSELGLKLWYEIEIEIKGKGLSFKISKSGAELPPPLPTMRRIMSQMLYKIRHWEIIGFIFQTFSFDRKLLLLPSAQQAQRMPH